MQEATTNPNVTQLLDELAHVLSEERDALIHMDAEGIERTAATKATLSEELHRRREEFNDTNRARLRVIQTDVRHNLILLVHARDHIQSTLGILTGRPTLPGQMHKAVAESVRLDLRG